jgi:hypothetical protein
LKYTRKHERRKGGTEPKRKAARLWRTVRPGGADCPQRPRRLSAKAARTVRQGITDCPYPCRGLSGLSRGLSEKGNKTSRDTPRITDRPRGARGLSARHPRTVRLEHADRPKPSPTKTQSHNGSKTKASKNTKNSRRTRTSRTVCNQLADCPRLADRAETCSTSKVNPSNPSADLPNSRSC